MLLNVKQCTLFVTLSMLLLALTACNDAEDKPADNLSFQLVRPDIDSTVTVIEEDGRLLIKINGDRESGDVFQILINGVDITSRMNIESTFASVSMASIAPVFIQGENTVVVNAISSLTNKTVSQLFTFFVDNVPPSLSILQVTVIDNNGNEIGGTPTMGDSIRVTGEINDSSNVESIVFTYPGDASDPNAASAVVELDRTTQTILGQNQFNNAERTFAVDLLNYPDATITPTKAHFTYTVEDDLDRSSTEGFVVSGGAISPGVVIQVDNEVLDLAAPYVENIITSIIDVVEGQNVFNVTDILVADADTIIGNNASAVIGDIIEDSTAAVIPPATTNEYGVPSNFAVLETYSNTAQFCNQLALQSSVDIDTPSLSGLLTLTDCLTVIKEFDLGNPSADVSFRQRSGTIQALVEVVFDELNVTVEIAGLHDDLTNLIYLGGWRSTLSMKDFKFEAIIDLVVDEDLQLGFELNEPVNVDVSQLFGPAIFPDCDPGVCRETNIAAFSTAFSIGASLPANFSLDFNGLIVNSNNDLLRLFREQLDGVDGPDMIYDDLKRIIEDNLNKPSAVSTQVTSDDGFISQIDSVNTVTVIERAQGSDSLLMQVLTSDIVDPSNYTQATAELNGGLGSSYVDPGDYSKWGATYADDQPFKFVMAVPSSAINQKLMAFHQSGRFEESSLDISNLVMPDFNVEAADQLRIHMATTTQVPTVSFTSAARIGLELCLSVEFEEDDEESNSTAVVDGSEEHDEGHCLDKIADLGFVEINLRNVDITIENLTDGLTIDTTPLLHFNADIVFTVGFGFDGTRPVILPTPDFVRIEMNRLDIPSDRDLSITADALDIALTEFANDPGLNSLLEPIIINETTASLTPIDISFLINEPDGTLSASYSSLLDALTPIEYGVVFRWMEVDSMGDYFSVGFDILTSEPNLPFGTSGFTDEEREDHIIQVRVDQL